ncbi:unnamed protein product, partial [Brassica oleracea var. botrytis]
GGLGIYRNLRPVISSHTGDCVSARMLSVACAVTHGRTHVFIHVSDTCRRIPTRPDGLLHGWSSCVATHGSPAMLQLQIRRHLVLLHVKLHVLLPCMPPRASRSVYAIFDPSGKFLTCDQSRIFFCSRSDA